jgi:hypothetical protein
MGLSSAVVFVEHSKNLLHLGYIVRSYVENIITLQLDRQKMDTSALTRQKQVRGSRRGKNRKNSNGAGQGVSVSARPMQIHVYISDVHAALFHSLIQWSLSLHPSIQSIKPVDVIMHSTSTWGANWKHSRAEVFSDVLIREEKAMKAFTLIQKSMQSAAELKTYLDFGLHFEAG